LVLFLIEPLDLLSHILVSLAAKQLVLEWTRNYCIEVQIAFHIGRDQTVVSLDELADLDFRE